MQSLELRNYNNRSLIIHFASLEITKDYAMQFFLKSALISFISSFLNKAINKTKIRHSLCYVINSDIKL